MHVMLSFEAAYSARNMYSIFVKSNARVQTVREAFSINSNFC